MRLSKIIFILSMLALALIFFASPALAQEEQPPIEPQGLVLFTDYPDQVIGVGETATFDLTLETDVQGETVHLDIQQVPEGWMAIFRGGGKIVQAVYVHPDGEATVDLRLEPPADVEPGSYQFVVLAEGSRDLELPLALTVKDRLPPRLSFEVDLPTLRGSPSTTFSYDATLENEGDEELSVNLVAEAAPGFLVNFQLSGQDVTNIPLAANESQRINVEAQAIADIPAGTYPIDVIAQGGDAEARLSLIAEVTGQSQLAISAPDGRLSGQAHAGRETPLEVILRNNGTAAAQGVELSASAPDGWSVTFDPEQIPEIAAGDQSQVTAMIRPAGNAVAGDYMLTLRARPADGTNESVDFRITVLTSTLWGIVGIALIAVAVGVVAIAVVRFGRR